MIYSKEYFSRLTIARHKKNQNSVRTSYSVCVCVTIYYHLGARQVVTFILFEMEEKLWTYMWHITGLIYMYAGSRALFKRAAKETCVRASRAYQLTISTSSRDLRNTLHIYLKRLVPSRICAVVLYKRKSQDPSERSLFRDGSPRLKSQSPRAFSRAKIIDRAHGKRLISHIRVRLNSLKKKNVIYMRWEMR